MFDSEQQFHYGLYQGLSNILQLVLEFGYLPTPRSYPSKTSILHRRSNTTIQGDLNFHLEASLKNVESFWCWDTSHILTECSWPPKWRRIPSLNAPRLYNVHDVMLSAPWRVLQYWVVSEQILPTYKIKATTLQNFHAGSLRALTIDQLLDTRFISSFTTDIAVASSSYHRNDFHKRGVMTTPKPVRAKRGKRPHRRVNPSRQMHRGVALTECWGTPKKILKIGFQMASEQIPRKKSDSAFHTFLAKKNDKTYTVEKVHMMVGYTCLFSLTDYRTYFILVNSLWYTNIRIHFW